jgi:hypothetical protein
MSSKAIFLTSLMVRPPGGNAYSKSRPGPDPGLTYNRDRVDVAVRITPASRALDEEARLIRRLRPRDNQIGQPEEEAIPF